MSGLDGKIQDSELEIMRVLRSSDEALPLIEIRRVLSVRRGGTYFELARQTAGDADLSVSKKLTFSPESGEYTKEFTLLNIKELPFVTYVPKTDWTAEHTDGGVTLKSGKLSYVEIRFFKDGTTQKEAEKELGALLGDISSYEKRDNPPKWEQASYYKWQKPEGKHAGGMNWAVLGSHAGRYFYIVTKYSDDTEGDLPPVQAVFSQWLWRDTNGSLGYSLD